MTTGVQISLFAGGAGTPGGHESEDSNLADLVDVERLSLGTDAWVDVKRSWLSGWDLLDSLLAFPDWRAEQRPMYDRIVRVPRLLRFFKSGENVPWPQLTAARNALSAYYQPALGEPFTSTGLCLYRDGQDSVAWHGDTIGRGATEDTVVAILSLGATRTFALRPRTSGPYANLEHGVGKRTSLHLIVNHGDLIVMGGTCQRTWEHAIPKTNKKTGPRVSIQFRPHGVS